MEKLKDKAKKKYKEKKRKNEKAFMKFLDKFEAEPGLFIQNELKARKAITKFRRPDNDTYNNFNKTNPRHMDKWKAKNLQIIKKRNSEK